MMDLFASDTVRWFFAAWFAFLGGAVGSFLNVVVYRLPVGMNISWPGSHCPRCKHPIRSYDNVPVLGWLWLRGRCRDCGQPISPRYPLVEAATAAAFILLMFVEIFHHGANLPQRASDAAHPAAYSDVRAIAICLLHLALLSTLFAAALMTLDGRRPPLRLFLPTALAGFFAPMFWPWLHPQPAGPDIAQFAWSGVIDSAVGLCFGACLGRILEWAGRRLSGIGRAGYQILGETVLLGVVLGWQPTLWLVLVAVMLEELTRIAAVRWRQLRNVTAAVWLVPLALLWILNWARLLALPLG